MDKYILRQQLLRALAEAEPGLLGLDQLAQWPLFQMAGLKAPSLLMELRALADHGYIRDERPGRAPLFRLLAPGRDQLQQEADLDEFVWGDLASRFRETL
jgi:DNA-binding transcriptional ArsR family regulator